MERIILYSVKTFVCCHFFFLFLVFVFRITYFEVYSRLKECTQMKSESSYFFFYFFCQLACEIASHSHKNKLCTSAIAYNPYSFYFSCCNFFFPFFFYNFLNKSTVFGLYFYLNNLRQDLFTNVFFCLKCFGLCSIIHTD